MSARAGDKRPVKPLPRKPGASVAAPVTPLFTLRAMQPTPKRSRKGLLAVLVISLLAAASYGGWYWWSNRPAPVVNAPARPVARPPVREPVAPPVLTGVKLPWSVAVASYQDASLAKTQREQIEGNARGVSFYVAPIMMQGKLFYRVMAGPVADSASALAVRDTLVAKRIKTITSGWDVLNTPFAFLIGEFTSRTDAEAQQQQAETKGVPTYIVAYKAPEGPTTYRIYAGAFTGPGDAAFMRPILKSAGLPDNLVERTGSIS